MDTPIVKLFRVNKGQFPYPERVLEAEIVDDRTATGRVVMYKKGGKEKIYATHTRTYTLDQLTPIEEPKELGNIRLHRFRNRVKVEPFGLSLTSNEALALAAALEEFVVDIDNVHAADSTIGDRHVFGTIKGHD